MQDLIATTFLLVGLSGMGVILLRKIPVLAELPFAEENQEGLFLKTIRKLNILEIFNFKNFWQKILLRIRILNLKIENKTSQALERLRQKEKVKDDSFFTCNTEDNYWEKLKKITKKTRLRK